ncbi:SpvB/TcaC N-terminal domain-containing protein [uncultured Microscilla sp.]|uniref:SpvB/TcaC N-terminal domain-containing protein n=1 Tax=uncultured Microscilla sp. TaxID=432653 RepID=UPI00261D5A08|nr:SpvB/TcaC N-terminal domain-containing protein [uncultured Microscilla sp.]
MNPPPENGSGQFLATDQGKTESNAIEIPSIALPKGGGAIKGIDEKLNVNAVNGTASFSIPLPFSPARGTTPALSLAYNSGAGNGIFGLGWSLSLPSIKRKTNQGLPQYLDAIDSDVFLLSEAEDLVPAFAQLPDGSFALDETGEYLIDEKTSPDGNHLIRRYHPRIEGGFARIERWQHLESGALKWRVTSRENLTTLYGWTAQARIADPANDAHIFEWLPEFSFDDKGNCAHYIYKQENAQGFDPALVHHQSRVQDEQLSYTNTYLSRVLYGNRTPYAGFGESLPPEIDYLFATVLDYGEYDATTPNEPINDWGFRGDAFSDYRAGFERRTTRLCQRVLLFHRFNGQDEYNGLVKSLDFGYNQTQAEGFTFLESITACGYIKQADGSYSKKAMPPLEFAYQSLAWNREVRTIKSEHLVHAPVGLSSPWQLTDLYNEGLAGVLTEQAGGWYYKANLGNGAFAQAQLVSPKPSFGGLGGQMQLSDLEADGKKQLVSYSPLAPGYFELNNQGEWEGFRRFDALPNIDLNDPNARWLDLNGDGKAEVLISQEQVFTWYASKGKKGFGQAKKTLKPTDENTGATLVFAEATQTIFLADMSGDGLTDIVRIRNGEVCYWSNLGYGRFGKKVTMSNAPWFDAPDAFNPALLRLADIDGSGTSDIIYLGKNKWTCWQNLHGNSFAETPFELEAFPAIHPQAHITVADLLGNGVACIVWSSGLAKDTTAPLQYIDLMGSQKPHLMVGYTNNLGKEVTMEYAPSTQFYLADQAAGTPWASRLHFPVHCLAKLTTEDKITGHCFTSSYTYHHGYYDHPEREFRGFGRVEQTDSESFAHWVKTEASNLTEEALHQAPVLTKTWHHTGAFLDNDRLLAQFEKDYWQAQLERQGEEVSHHETTLVEMIEVELNPQEWVEALRACKGRALRSEVFAQDATEDATAEEQLQALTPYTVTQSNWVVKLLQPKGNNAHAVFMVQPSQSLSYHYERNPEDPRIAHQLNVAFDEYGNVLESAAVVYPRQVTDASLPAATQAAQSTTTILYTQNAFTNDVIDDEAYRLRLPAETKTFALKGVPKDGNYYQLSDFDQILSNTHSEEALYHEIDQPLTADKAQRRLIEHVRSTYYQNNLSGALPLYQLESLGLPYESYQLAYTPELVADIFGTKVGDAVLTEGRFCHSEGDANWWVRSGVVQFITDSETPAEAQARFYVPVAFADAYEAVTKVRYYGNEYLLIAQTEDALGNRAGVNVFNFRTLAPQQMYDINGNLSESLSDELGLAKALAVMGKGNEADALTGLEATSNASETANIESFFAAADSDALTNAGKALLQHATTRFVYDLAAYTREGKPVVVAAISREQHSQQVADSPVQIALEYGNGLGEVVMQKTQAAPGLAKQVVINADESITINEVDTTPQLRWIGNGRTVKNNKGNVVKQYEPYFSVSHHYEDTKELVETGVSPVLYYDAVGRLIRTDMPNGTFSKVSFTAWRQSLYDANDTVLESDWYAARVGRLIDEALIADGKDPAKEENAAEQTALHAQTPQVLHLDTLGRPVLQIDNNKELDEDHQENETFYHTQANLDTEGNLRAVTDARDNLVMRYKYDMLGNKVYQESMDAGKRWLLLNVVGKPLRTWDERDHEFRYFYDALQRPSYSQVLGGDGDTPLDHIFSRTIYGEQELTAGRDNEAAVQALNILGQVTRQYDTGGLVHSPAYDFKGQPLSTSRQLFSKYKEVANWTEANMLADLENEAFVFTTRTDALGRIVEQTTPDGSVITPSYNETGLLTSETVTHPSEATPSTYIARIAYNAKGQREKIVYGNQVTSRYSYDSETFGLLRLVSQQQNGDPLQDWRYTYDPVGNICQIEDSAAPVVFFNNQKITSLATYTYDALYRLIAATGRENSAALSFGNQDNWNDDAFAHDMQPNDPMAMRNYTQSYQYDSVGNILQMKHTASGNNWTRHYAYETANNRLTSTQVGSYTYSYAYHTQHGFMTSLPHLADIGWNFLEQVARTNRQQRSDGGTPETTYYQYDGSRQRLRKITENAADAGMAGGSTKKDERIYVAGYELYKCHNGANVGLERETLSLLDEGHRFVMIDRRNAVNDGTEETLVRYQLHNHLGSAALELNETAEVISYEEYHPYGTTAYQATNATIGAAAKRYCYTGMERDEETGLEYHSARYYLPWLGRWLSTDPIGIGDGVNVYGYVRGNPVRLVDGSGRQSLPPEYYPDPMFQLGRGFGALFEFFVGGKADPIRDEKPSLPQGGIGGVVGGVADTATLRLTGVLENDPTLLSQVGMEVGASQVPVVDPALRLATGETVTGQDTNRLEAAATLTMDVLPLATSNRTLTTIAKKTSGTSHIGSSSYRSSQRVPTETNPTCRGDLCVADVGAHHANKVRPKDSPLITNEEFVAASGRPVHRVNNPIENRGQAVAFLNQGYEGLYNSGRISQRIEASIPSGNSFDLKPGAYLMEVDGPMGGHAIHVNVSNQIIGTKYIHEGRIISKTDALELMGDGERVHKMPLYQMEFYDPQNGVCIDPDMVTHLFNVRGFIRLD